MQEADDLRDEVRSLEGRAAAHEAEAETAEKQADEADAEDAAVDLDFWELQAIRHDPRQMALLPC